ncbi:MAG: glycoside hydrolase [Bacteroidetes bacterium GWF2_42_66]|nr:MAG: glycoside hydrolase [Bacteroidetes bacterium GWA2_42_15]OFX98539.1 MAG: glycoside hydrolase [Bacteroidetes bacterium GWE2_42_39]OFY42921.1 MAG: glycoside hydrolase [Bacteroidetes bacterium GWF2_42_66]HBL75335.1 glycoside hydrolase [Prolixibacteraceae bacterium]HCR91488.1 glycoside hydrolase [Prolixibacteraceae bacterium]
MKLLILIFLIFLVSGCREEITAQKYELVWSDEFGSNGLPDTDKWGYESGLVRNKEAQYYTIYRKENARVENGMLIIEARKEKYQDAEYTSASINTFNKKHFLYGRFEVRAKLPVGKGTWPAIWMLGTNKKEKGWPVCGEIDIMENVGFDSLKIHANIHTGEYNHVKGTGKGSTVVIDKPWDDFHVYALEWSKDRLDFFVDSQKYFTYLNDGANNEQTWPFGKPQYLLLNLAIGGAWGGQKGINDAAFPHQYCIDYVRVYQKDK